jgi:zinc protease
MRAVVAAAVSAVLFVSLNAQGQQMNRTKPPQTPNQPAFKLPAVHETRLPNGLEVVLVEDARFPMVTARLGFQAGSKYDPQDLPGLSETTGALLTEGTTHRSSRQIAEDAASIGGSLSAGSSPDALMLSGSALAEILPKLLELMADVARNANFPEDEVALRKQNRTQELLADRSDAAFLADEKLNEVLFSPHPYAKQDPTPESIARISRAALEKFRDERLAPNNAVLVLLGALPEQKKVVELIGKNFGDWPRREVAPAPKAAFPAPKRTIVLVDRPGSVQADIRIGRLAVTRTDPDYFPLLVGNTILGGGTSSRIFMNIREKKGFAYDARSSAVAMKDGGDFAVITQVRNEVLAEAIHAALDEMKRISTQPVSADELATAKNYLSGTFVMRLETQDGLASQLALVRLMGLAVDYLEKYTRRVRAVTADEIRAAAAKYIAPENASIVVVGDASKISRQLETFGTVKIVKAE